MVLVNFLPNTSSKEIIFMKRLFPILVPFINDMGWIESFGKE